MEIIPTPHAIFSNSAPNSHEGCEVMIDEVSDCLLTVADKWKIAPTGIFWRISSHRTRIAKSLSLDSWILLIVLSDNLRKTSGRLLDEGVHTIIVAVCVIVFMMNV